MHANVLLLFQIWQDSLINTGHTYSGWIFKNRPFHGFNIFLLSFVGHTEISLFSGVFCSHVKKSVLQHLHWHWDCRFFIHYCTDLFFSEWPAGAHSGGFSALSITHFSQDRSLPPVDALHKTSVWSAAALTAFYGIRRKNRDISVHIKGPGCFSRPLPLEINLASDVTCIVQTGTQDLCRLVHVLRHCAIKYKPSVCWLRAVNWHFADCRLSVSHRQILAGALLLGACRWCHCRGGQSHRPPPPPHWNVFGPHRGSDGPWTTI